MARRATRRNPEERYANAEQIISSFDRHHTLRTVVAVVAGMLVVGAALAVLLLTACGSAPAEKEVTASNVEISGFLKNYVKVIDETFSTDCEDDEPTTSQSSSSNSSVSSSSSSDEWDAVLDEYEEYMDSYIKMYKKAQAGDMDAMTEYVTLLEKAESFQNKLDNAKSDLSVAQMNRFSKIISKMASAM